MAIRAPRVGTLPGTSLGRSVGTVSDTLTTTEIDLNMAALSITVPPDRDVEVTWRVPGVGAVTASAQVTVKLTDDANAVKDSDFMRSGTASRNFEQLFGDELIPAGSGTVIRKLRGVSTTADGSTLNALNLHAVLKAKVV